MIFLRLLLNSGLIFIIGEAFPMIKKREVKDDPDPMKFLQDHVTPLNYNIHIVLQQFLEAEPKNFSGKCTIYIKIDIPISFITLYAQKRHIEIHDIYLVEKYSNKTYVIGTSDYRQGNNVLFIFFQENILSGYYSLHLSYNGSLDDNEVFFKSSYINDNGQKTWLIATQTFAARQLFPCWDAPILKATFDITIKHYDSYKILSNMPALTIMKDNDRMQWTNFKTTPTMSTYCIGFILYDLFFIPNINLWHRHKESSVYVLLLARNVITQVITYFENWKTFRNVPYIHHIVIPGFRYNINDMDKCNLIFYRETTVIYDERFDSVAHKIEVVRLIARKLTYQWLDNQVNSTSSELWLYQGIAMLLGTNIVNKSFPNFRMMDLFVVQIQQESLRLDSDPHFYLPFSYNIKASAILRNLQHILTDEKFRYGIEIFYNASTTSTTLDDFWKAMQKAYGEKSISILNIKEKMNSWIKLKHYPVLMVRQYPNMTISIENNKSLVCCRELNILVTITKETEPDFTISMDKPYTFWLSSSSINNFYFFHHLNEWIIVNTQQIGYYRVNYETNNWLNIARYLNNITLYKKIHVLNRAQIIDDAYYFVKTGQMNLSTFLNLTEYLSHETDYVAWYPMFKVLEDMSNIFLFSSEEINHFKEKIGKSLYELLQRITYTETPMDNELIKCLRQEAAKWLCVFGHFNCKNAAEMKLNHYIKRGERNKILPWWKEWIYCNGLTRSSTFIWNKISQAYTEELDTKILKFLCCSQNPFVMIHKMLTTVPKDHLEQIQHNDHIFYFHNIIERHARNETMLIHILENLKNIKPKQFNTIAALIDIINHIYSENVLNTIIPLLENIIIKSEITIIDKIHLTHLEIYECVRTLMKKRILLIHHKVNIRLSQIESQKNRFHFIKI